MERDSVQLVVINVSFNAYLFPISLYVFVLVLFAIPILDILISIYICMLVYFVCIDSFIYLAKHLDTDCLT